MHFTREPMIETVITPKEGCKLLIRSSKGEDHEEFLVEALEVVSFGHSHFFRSPERPNSFLVPVTHYEVLETKDMKMPLKLSGNEKSTQQKMPARRQQREVEEEESVVEGPEEPSERYEKKRDRRRGRRRRGGGMEIRPEPKSSELQPETVPELVLENGTQGEGVETAGEVAPSFISKLFPPPPTLIKETLSRYKVTEDGENLSQDVISPPPEKELRDINDETKFED